MVNRVSFVFWKASGSWDVCGPFVGAPLALAWAAYYAMADPKAASCRACQEMNKPTLRSFLLSIVSANVVWAVSVFDHLSHRRTTLGSAAGPGGRSTAGRSYVSRFEFIHHHD